PLVRRVVRYEVITVDTAWEKRVLRRFHLALDGLFRFFTKGGALAHHALSAARLAQVEPWAEKVTTGPEGFALASTVDNAAVKVFVNANQAQDFLDAQVAAEPALAGTLHVVPAFEAVGV